MDLDRVAYETAAPDHEVASWLLAKVKATQQITAWATILIRECILRHKWQQVSEIAQTTKRIRLSIDYASFPRVWS